MARFLARRCQRFNLQTIEEGPEATVAAGVRSKASFCLEVLEELGMKLETIE